MFLRRFQRKITRVKSPGKKIGCVARRVVSSIDHIARQRIRQSLEGIHPMQDFLTAAGDQCAVEACGGVS